MVGFIHIVSSLVSVTRQSQKYAHSFYVSSVIKANFLNVTVVACLWKDSTRFEEEAGL